MKRAIIILIIAILVVGTVSAQAIREQQNPAPKEKTEQLRDVPQSRNSRTRENNPVTVEGTLKLEKGFVAVEDASNVYVVPMLNRYIGFITGLREGAKVSVEGYEFRNMIRPTKVTIEGKAYDFMTGNRNQCPGVGKRDFRPDNNRRTPGPGWDNRSYGNRNRNGRDNRCYR